MADNDDSASKSNQAQQPPAAPIIPENEAPGTHATQDSSNDKACNSKNITDFAMVRWTRAVALLTGALFIAALLQFWAMHGQQTVMRGQLDEMQAEQRPWVYADIHATGAIYLNQFGLNIPIAFKLHNTGHLPAMYVSPDIEAYLSGAGGKLGSQTVQERQQKRCGHSLQEPSSSDQIGVTVFPGQLVDFGINSGIPAAKIDAVRKLWQEEGKEMNTLFPWVTGCIRYRSPDGAFHQTGVAFTISMIKPGKEGIWSLPIDPTSIDPKSLVVQPWLEGGTAYAN